MVHPPRTTSFRRFLLVGTVSFLVLTLFGCGYIGFYTRRSTWRSIFKSTPRMSVLNRFAPENALLLTGKIHPAEQREEPLLLAAVSSRYKPNEIVALTTLREPVDDYTLFLPKGDYGLFVFADVNGDGYFERNELVGHAPSVIVGHEHPWDGAVVEGPAITVNFDQPGKTVFRVRVKVQAVSYIYDSLDDEFFDPEYGSAGLYNPAGLMAHTQGFLFGLEDYDETKTLVLFVHGISGTPRDWKFFVDGLDRSRFQPFFLYYPSGMPLDKLGSLLAQVILSLDDNGDNPHQKIVLVAHSMGGLVAMSAIEKLAVQGLPSSLKMYISISTPYGGDDRARTWGESAPLVVPVWRDLATGSDFLKELARKPFPKTLPFYLFFTYDDPSTFKLGESSDGVVALRSELTPSAQQAAVKVIGFNETHEGVLTSKKVRRALYALLDSVSPPQNERETKPWTEAGD